MNPPEPKPANWPCNDSFFRGKPTEEPQPKPARGRPRKPPGAPKSPYTMSAAARKARSKGGRALTLEQYQAAQRAAMASRAAKLAEGAK